MDVCVSSHKGGFAHPIFPSLGIYARPVSRDRVLRSCKDSADNVELKRFANKGGKGCVLLICAWVMYLTGCVWPKWYLESRSTLAEGSDGTTNNLVGLALSLAGTSVYHSTTLPL